MTDSAYGKYNSLTLVNWNGFFARTFELDDLVTTLSGGNGAGKSTTMAGFITALIPDLTLLHFRNTTEAGSTSGSRDKGLHGKLRPGVCYAILDILTSRNQRVLCGVRLQQVAGRDKKVDIKPFIIQGLPANMTPIEIVTEKVSGQQVRVRAISELGDQLKAFSSMQFKQCNSIIDYHSMMFDLGILPKRLRSTMDRSKYYRLLEASLYGGISSTITRSLRDYLLPENCGVRKAFQDMELALRENRMTLEAIRVTQRDRDLFKHLIAASIDYVAADYMRHINERREKIKDTITLRNELFSSKMQLLELCNRQVDMTGLLQSQSSDQKNLETDYQAAIDYLNLVQTAIKQREKIDRYQGDLEELQYQLEEHGAIVEETNEILLSQQLCIDETEHEADEIKSQLADHQRALDSQQTRAIQYQQALQALDKAKKVCQLSCLSESNVADQYTLFLAKEKEITEQLLALEQAVNVVDARVDKYETAYSLVKKLQNNVTQETAWVTAKAILKAWTAHVHHAEYAEMLQSRLTELEQRWYDQQEAKQLFSSLCHTLGKHITIEQLAEVKLELQAQLNEISKTKESDKQKQVLLEQEQQQLINQIQLLKKKAPRWLQAQDKRNTLSELSGQELCSSQQVMAYMQQLLAEERKLTVEKDKLLIQRQQHDEQIVRLSQSTADDTGLLHSVAERFNGTLLADIYDDVSLADAPYFSALYGPFCQAIVVPDLQRVKRELSSIDECPDDIYFIEGDPASFDASVFDCEDLGHAVLVKIADRQWRYSRFPSVPLFGRAAREAHVEALSRERETLAKHYASVSFDLQKIHRLQQHVSQFIGEHMAIAFDIDPEAAISKINERSIDIERQVALLKNIDKERYRQIAILEKQLLEINQLAHYQYLLLDHNVAEKVDEIRQKRVDAQVSVDYVKQNKTLIAQLEPLVSLLKNPPSQHQAILEKYQKIQNTQRDVKQQVFALKEVLARKTHFGYVDAVHMLDENSDLSEQLRKRLLVVEAERNMVREQVRHYQLEYNQHSQTLASLKSAYDTKQDILNELKKEIAQTGVQEISVTSEKKAVQRRDSILQQLNANRTTYSRIERELLLCENNIDQLQKRIKRTERDYQLLRQQVVQDKKIRCTVMRLVKNNNAERHLYRRELAYLSSNELRSMSDKALGSLRQAVADNEHLRDVLRASEDAKYSEGKIHFYLAVYSHLRERIRHDIIKTDDPIEAIEQMEIELSRLVDELTTREQKMAISAKSVANIIRKTIQREQHRIYMLNQGLQTVIFGQVNGVRLHVNVRESHTTLLAVLAEQQDKHQDLFTNSRITFSEALAKLYQRLNPHIDLGQRTAQTLGEELLDYRNYLDLEIEVNRGADGWLRAESGALSTGEAIGTGMSILLMVTQSWEEESKRLRSKDILPCRLLFLDEAARLDTKSIATLFELCERLNMQLIIAAPENISPEKGTTYKLVRKVFNHQEHVHVVGLRGFA